MTTLEDLTAELERHAAQRWWRRALRECRRQIRVLPRRPRDIWLPIKWAWQRVTVGWDDRALWAVDNHIASHLGAQLQWMGVNTCGYMDDYPLADWRRDLTKAGDALVRYSRKQYEFGDDRAVIYADAQAAMHWTADNFGALWD